MIHFTKYAELNLIIFAVFYDSKIIWSFFGLSSTILNIQNYEERIGNEKKL